MDKASRVPINDEEKRRKDAGEVSQNKMRTKVAARQARRALNFVGSSYGMPILERPLSSS